MIKNCKSINKNLPQGYIFKNQSISIGLKVWNLLARRPSNWTRYRRCWTNLGKYRKMLE